jgi:molybdate-binding protein
VLRPERADGITGIKDLAGSGLRLVNREPGAEARSLLDRTLPSPPPASGVLGQAATALVNGATAHKERITGEDSRRLPRLIT